MTSDILIGTVDVDYRKELAVAVGLWFRGWRAATVERDAVAVIRDVAPYQSGEFYRRELPCIMTVLSRGPRCDVVVVDGYAWLENNRAGLGAHLHDALGGKVAVVGVAKTQYSGATNVIPVCRGRSRSPLFVSAVGIDATEAATLVTSMHGKYRIPMLLKQVDQLARRQIV